MSNIRFLLNNAKQSISRGKTVIDKLVAIRSVFHHPLDRYADQMDDKKASDVSSEVPKSESNYISFNDSEWKENTEDINPDYNPWE